jgi:hypothetical protein
VAQQQPTVFDLPKVLAVGIASPAAAAITARFGVAGTLIGLALSAVFITAAVDFLKVYLARVPGAVTTIPGGFRKRSSLGNVFERMKRPFSKFASLPPTRRRSILIGSVAAAGISFIVGLIVVTGLELGVGKSLSCWVWEECSTEESSADGNGTTRASTLPSILGGGQSSASSSTPQVEVSPSSPQQEEPGSSPSTPGVPSQVPDAPEVETPDPSLQQQGPSEVIEDIEEAQQDIEEAQQQIPSSSTPADQQRSSADDSEGQ